MKGGIFQWDEFNSIFDDMKNETCSELGKHLIETCKNEGKNIHWNTTRGIAFLVKLMK